MHSYDSGRSTEGLQPTILIVEGLAHLDYGHVANRFVELAEALVEAGCRVTVLTAQGWARQNEYPTPRFDLLAYGPVPSAINRVAVALRPSPALKGQREAPALEGAAARVVRGFRGLVSSSASLLAVRRALATTSLSGASVLMLTSDFDPRFAMTAGGSARWLVTVFRPPDLRWPASLNRLVGARAEARQHAGVGVVLSAPSRSVADSWRLEVPSAEVRELPLAGVRRAPRVADARRALGVADDARVALLFGSHETERDSPVVVEALRRAEGWHLLVGGQLTENLVIPDEPWARERVHVVPGRSSNATRDLLYSAADLVVLSFKDGYERNSGTLMDAISYGVPVVCSRGSAASRVVEAFGVGATFAASDPDDLALAIVGGPPADFPERLVGAREALSNDAVAARLLAHLIERESAR